ncbi:extensin family protein [Porphyrobacter sp. CACIAM 03H1]|uniref:extensin-like domain-containing protein n=1 Tax=Porphyrobacter sp. CACIAM 03H1 TaxID=2003315 RepID=UPI000B5AB4C0|nr:extensin family protein [Porphyrobacter sp. CACIAM 03H1]ASJ91194.1 extensin [Porphyrobacter sp. CACIAM 03H1]
MPPAAPNPHFRAARRALFALVPLLLAIAGWQWLQNHPQHNPWAPLDLRDPPGWATRTKLARLKEDVGACRAVLARSDIVFTALDAAGEGECARPDRTRLGDYPLSPDTPPVTCPVAIALELWRRDSVAPAARRILGSDIARIEHLGAFSCRRMYGASEGRWSEHATGNAIDIAGFVLEDGRRISVLGDWDGEGTEARFLREVRDGACKSFATVLSPDYNAAHADHFHLDQDGRWSGVCR